MAVGVASVALALSGACSSSQPSPAAARSVSLGGGTTATLGADGHFAITQQGKTLLGTASGQPLLTRALDANNPTGWHDPKNLTSDTFTQVADSAIEIDSPAPGVVHLSTTADTAPTVLVSLALASDAGFYTGLGERYDHTAARGQIIGMQLEIAKRGRGTSRRRTRAWCARRSRGRRWT